MSLKLAGRLFTGPFPVDTTEVRANQVPVVYAIVAKGGPSWAPVFRVVDIGSSPEQGMSFAVHSSRADWVVRPGETLGIYLFYTRRSQYSAADRERMVYDLRQRYDPPKGFIE
jgi:hypothetical protein